MPSPGDDRSRPRDARVEPARAVTPMYAAIGRVLARVAGGGAAQGSAFANVVATIIAFGVVLVAGVLLFGPVIGEEHGPSFETVIDAADPDDQDTWRASSFDAVYELSRDQDGRFVADVTETIELRFPEGISSRVIERTIASQSEDQQFRPTPVSATIDGAAVPFTSNGGTPSAVLTAAAPAALGGTHTVELRYRLSDLAIPTRDERSGVESQLWAWNAFGTNWDHPVFGLRLSVHVPEALASYTRTPAGGVNWLLVAGSGLIDDPEYRDGEFVYELTNSNALPPYATAWLDFPFQSDTFVIPDPPPVPLWALLLPVLPLLLLGGVLLLTLAARVAVWKDAPGAPWYVPQHDPPEAPAGIAARVWGAGGSTAALVDFLAQQPRNQSVRRATKAHELALRSTRAGVADWFAGKVGSKRRITVRLGLRRVPTGFVRRWLIVAAVVLVLLQAGAIRQVVGREGFDQYWWPALVALLSLAIASIIIGAVRTDWPLTERGALLRQYLLGLRDAIEQTSLRERITASDPLLPYVVLFASQNQRAAVLDRVLPLEQPAPAGADPGGPTNARIGRAVLAGVLLVAAIGAAIWIPPAYPRTEDAIFSHELPQTSGAAVSRFSIDAALTTTDFAAPRLAVVEQLELWVADADSTVPQLLRQYRDVAWAHDMGLRVESVTIDGAEVPFAVNRAAGMALLSTTFGEPWPGVHDVEIRLSYDDPIARVNEWGETSDRLVWTALNLGWQSHWEYDLPGTGEDRLSWQMDGAVEGGTASLTIPASLVPALRSAEESNLSKPPYADPELEPLAAPIVAGGTATITQTLAADEDGWIRNGYQDLGFELDFDANAFPAASDADWWRYVVATGWPIVALWMVAVMAGALALAAIVRRPRTPSALRDVLRWGPAVLFVCWICLAVVTGRGKSAYDAGWASTVVVCVLVLTALSVTALVVTRPAVVTLRASERGARRSRR